MKYITEIIRYFTYITTGMVILFIVLMLIQGDDGIRLSTLIEIPCAALLTSAITVLLYPSEGKTRKAYLCRVLLHYLALCVVMIVMGILFGWIELNFHGILLMVISVAAIYAFTFVVAYITSKNEAEELNRALKKWRSK
ncbi:MAG: DUF3021 family protein [Ruminiclostridium sp.]|nr:DUF3021 family protein [Ruminiclostridium sp.]